MSKIIHINKLRSCVIYLPNWDQASKTYVVNRTVLSKREAEQMYRNFRSVCFPEFIYDIECNEESMARKLCQGLCNRLNESVFSKVVL